MDDLNPSGILPSSISDERYIILDKLISRLDHIELEAVLTCFVDKVSDGLLYTLAEQFHLLGTEGWFLAESPEQKRELIRNSILLHRRRGTKWAMEYILKLLDLSGTVTEWWQKEPKGEPFTFDIGVDLKDKVVSEALSNNLMGLISSHKNVRSWAKISYERAAEGNIYVGGAPSMKNTIHLYPLVMPLSCEGRYYTAGTSHSMVCLRVAAL